MLAAVRHCMVLKRHNAATHTLGTLSVDVQLMRCSVARWYGLAWRISDPTPIPHERPEAAARTLGTTSGTLLMRRCRGPFGAWKNFLNALLPARASTQHVMPAVTACGDPPYQTSSLAEIVEDLAEKTLTNIGHALLCMSPWFKVPFFHGSYCAQAPSS